MSFIVNWDGLDECTVQIAKTALKDVLNRGNKPSVVVGDFEVKQLNVGSVVCFHLCLINNDITTTQTNISTKQCNL
jgi:SUMO ligase MMS21 Smc5/6 complex component